MAKELWSIFTDDMDKCIITGMTTGIERHHVFEGRMGFKKVSELYGFIAPLHRSLHPNGAWVTSDNWVDLDHYLKRKCQEYFIDNYGDREQWYEIFGRYYDDRTDERIWLNEDKT
jgi:hypothetical protein